MSTVFVGGSRQISRLSTLVQDRLENIVKSGHDVIVGDANGGDKAVQRYLLEAGYKAVTVYCSGSTSRNNLGAWPERRIQAPKSAKGFEFYAIKDREMALSADFGLMLWDGKSAGTMLNILRLVRAHKKAVLLDTSRRVAVNFKSAEDWTTFVAKLSPELTAQLRDRATSEEWSPAEQSSLFAAPEPADGTLSVSAAAEIINAALNDGNTAGVVTALGDIAKARGMSQVAKDAGLARESLYRSLSSGGNPEFSTVLKVIESVGLKLSVSSVSER
ncbi:MAG: putative addiction module antidote protein [Terricaulis sp.]